MTSQCHEYFDEAQPVAAKNQRGGRRRWLIAHHFLPGMSAIRRLSCRQNHPPPSAFFIYANPLKYRIERKSGL